MYPEQLPSWRSACWGGRDVFSIKGHSVIMFGNGGQEEEAGIKPQPHFSSRLLLSFLFCMVTLNNSACWSSFPLDWLLPHQPFSLLQCRSLTSNHWQVISALWVLLIGQDPAHHFTSRAAWVLMGFLPVHVHVTHSDLWWVRSLGSPTVRLKEPELWTLCNCPDSMVSYQKGVGTHIHIFIHIQLAAQMNLTCCNRS